MADDMMRENAMLKAENMTLRQRVRALQETVESATARSTQLQADRDHLALMSSSAAGIVFIYSLLHRQTVVAAR